MDEFEIFCLEDDETYEKICGEILLTTKRRLVMQCTMCDSMFTEFEAYFNHMFEQHMEPSEEVEEKPYMEELSPNDFLESVDGIEDETVTIKLEIEPLDTDALKEMELPISMLKESSIKTPEPSKPPHNSKKPEVQKVVSNDEFVIPSVIREVMRKKPVIRKSAPEEERKHKCPICGLGFKEKHNMRYHFKRHSNEKNHECPDCGKKFYTLSEVRVHRKFHSSKREYLCSDCGRAFRTRFQLTNHTKRHKNQRDFKCSICDKAFFDNETLQSHVRVHTLERPFTCKSCNATFSRQTALRNHIKLHENKREYKCHLCNAGFNQQAGLFSHMKVTHKAA